MIGLVSRARSNVLFMKTISMILLPVSESTPVLFIIYYLYQSSLSKKHIRVYSSNLPGILRTRWENNDSLLCYGSDRSKLIKKH